MGQKKYNLHYDDVREDVLLPPRGTTPAAVKREYPAGIWCENDIVLTSLRRDYVASTLIRRHFDTKCPLGKF